jgi:hypothetical protein
MHCFGTSTAYIYTAKLVGCAPETKLAAVSKAQRFTPVCPACGAHCRLGFRIEPVFSLFPVRQEMGSGTTMKISFTTIMAVWGAALSSFTFVSNLLRDRRDRPNVKLTAELEQTKQDSYGQPIPVEKGTASGIVGTQLVVTITNVGRRSVVITCWGSTNPSDSERHLQSLQGRHSKALAEGEYHKVHANSPRQSVLSDSALNIFVRDSSGRNWYMPRKRFKALRNEAKKLVGS